MIQKYNKIVLECTLFNTELSLKYMFKIIISFYLFFPYFRKNLVGILKKDIKLSSFVNKSEVILFKIKSKDIRVIEHMI